MLTVRNLYFGYGDTPVLNGIDLHLRRGEILSVVGPNGTGKSTLLKCIARIIDPDRGQARFDGKDVRDMTRRELARVFGYVPQHVNGKLPVTVFEAVLMGRRPHMAWKPSNTDLEMVSETLDAMDLGALALKDLGCLSGGQQQKVLLARAVVQSPACLLLDEPTSNLDLKHQLEVMALVTELVRKNGLGAMIAMHDLNLASRFSDKVLMIRNGSVFSAGKSRDVLTASNIRSVYGVEVTIVPHTGAPYILPKHPVMPEDVMYESRSMP